MADPVIKRWPVALSQAELQSYATLNDRYAATLPFKYRAVDCYCSAGSGILDTKDCCGSTPPLWFSNLRAKCIERTRERWTWFSSAREMDYECGERLGTLIHLPWEVRQMIVKGLFKGALDDHDIDFVGESTSISDIFRLDWTRSYVDSYHGLWFTSPSTKAEMKQYYLIRTKFAFYRPKDLEGFVDRLTISEWSLLRSVTLGVSGERQHTYPLSEWMTACARLPPNLLSIEFSASNWDLRFVEIGGQWFIVYYRPVNPVDPQLRRAITIIDVLGKQARRIAARATIGLSGSKVEPEEVAKLEVEPIRVLDDLEPWSEDWLTWWEESSRIDLNDGKTFAKVA